MSLLMFLFRALKIALCSNLKTIIMSQELGKTVLKLLQVTLIALSYLLRSGTRKLILCNISQQFCYFACYKRKRYVYFDRNTILFWNIIFLIAFLRMRKSF